MLLQLLCWLRRVGGESAANRALSRVLSCASACHLPTTLTPLDAEHRACSFTRKVKVSKQQATSIKHRAHATESCAQPRHRVWPFVCQHSCSEDTNAFFDFYDFYGFHARETNTSLRTISGRLRRAIMGIPLMHPVCPYLLTAAADVRTTCNGLKPELALNLLCRSPLSSKTPSF